MYKIVVALSLLAGPALATGLEIEIAGEANGTVKIDLYEDIAPGHVEQITALASEGAYDGVVFHRVIDGFMAQTGDVQFGKLEGGDMGRAGMGGSERPDLNSGNSQFFIMFDAGEFLNGQYTVVGQVTEGLEIVDAIKRGTGPNGAVVGQPDVMTRVTVTD